RKLRCYIGKEKISLNDVDHPLKIYNPYNKNIQLDKLRFATSFLNESKQFNEVVPASLLPWDKDLQHLKSKDTTYFTLKLPKPEKDISPAYFRIVISENELRYGLNSAIFKLN
ncbi:MAG: 4-amino-4-deoxy-L-arabinose transferase, partial [Maribacter sp.]|nr:4-amino-4-deoxy-L-arabinose transferase [Maribacter sp.]